MKKLYKDTIMGSSGMDCVLIILFQLYVWALRLGFLKVIYSGWVSTTSANLHIGRKSNPVLI